ncbi:TPA: RNA-binding protein, partial [Candidatus Woesearchaeota archaeon]|nr:RNA-binding protein [Candidatus Woesearchaeota archaeon]
NGWVWLNSEDAKMELIAIETIKKIEAEATQSGLTDRIKEFLEKKTGKKVEPSAIYHEQQEVSQ